jgi:hypothetical protein
VQGRPNLADSEFDFFASEPTLGAKPEPTWKLYEKAIHRIEKSFKNCTVMFDHTIRGKLGDTDRQVDV